ncbi:hypothetical protein M231_02773 [Tremella mesenterica]|uniref:Ribosomal protein mS38 C-terminal domain-containing protein n=1 Tax=Tremella mesenterica TaxID=5217 RepID=A0A4Q1BPZ3_TREME|nr:hypothetical protein M231_02773 [Tremella mesenterica]
MSSLLLYHTFRQTRGIHTTPSPEIIRSRGRIRPTKPKIPKTTLSSQPSPSNTSIPPISTSFTEHNLKSHVVVAPIVQSEKMTYLSRRKFRLSNPPTPRHIHPGQLRYEKEIRNQSSTNRNSKYTPNTALNLEMAMDKEMDNRRNIVSTYLTKKIKTIISLTPPHMPLPLPLYSYPSLLSSNFHPDELSNVHLPLSTSHNRLLDGETWSHTQMAVGEAWSKLTKWDDMEDSILLDHLRVRTVFNKFEHLAPVQPTFPTLSSIQPSSSSIQNTQVGKSDNEGRQQEKEFRSSLNTRNLEDIEEEDLSLSSSQTHNSSKENNYDSGYSSIGYNHHDQGDNLSRTLNEAGIKTTLSRQVTWENVLHHLGDQTFLQNQNLTQMNSNEIMKNGNLSQSQNQQAVQTAVNGLSELLERLHNEDMIQLDSVRRKRKKKMSKHKYKKRRKATRATRRRLGK